MFCPTTKRTDIIKEKFLALLKCFFSLTFWLGLVFDVLIFQVFFSYMEEIVYFCTQK